MHRPSLFCRSIIPVRKKFVNTNLPDIFVFPCIDGIFPGHPRLAQIKEVQIHGKQELQEHQGRAEHPEQHPEYPEHQEQQERQGQQGLPLTRKTRGIADKAAERWLRGLVVCVGSGVGALRKHAGGMFLASDLGGYAAVASILSLKVPSYAVRTTLSALTIHENDFKVQMDATAA